MWYSKQNFVFSTRMAYVFLKRSSRMLLQYRPWINFQRRNEVKYSGVKYIETLTLGASTFCSSQNITVKSRCMNWAVHVPCIKDTRNTYKILVQQTHEMTALGRLSSCWEESTSIDKKGKRLWSVKRFKGAQERAKQQGHASEPLGSISTEELRGQLKEILENSVLRSWLKVS